MLKMYIVFCFIEQCKKISNYPESQVTSIQRLSIKQNFNIFSAQSINSIYILYINMGTSHACIHVHTCAYICNTHSHMQTYTYIQKHTHNM